MSKNTAAKTADKTVCPDAPRKIYVEPTSLCNLTCSFCLRNIWDPEEGEMTPAVFGKVLKYLEEADPVPDIFF